jgi:hypothetical protein
MTDSSNPPSHTILHVAAAYAFEVQYCTPLEKWIIKGKSAHGVEFYWDSTYKEQDFFDELASFWRQDGVESSYPY